MLSLPFRCRKTSSTPSSEYMSLSDNDGAQSTAWSLMCGKVLRKTLKSHLSSDPSLDSSLDLRPNKHLDTKYSFLPFVIPSVHPDQPRRHDPTPSLHTSGLGGPEDDMDARIRLDQFRHLPYFKGVSPVLRISTGPFSLLYPAFVLHPPRQGGEK
jgi:hypothetical protein